MRQLASPARETRQHTRPAVHSRSHRPVPVFTPQGRDPRRDYHGYPVLDGWPHSPVTPTTLRQLTRAPLNAPLANRLASRDAFDRRARYALPLNGRPTTTLARLQSPALRGRNGCLDLPDLLHLADPAVRTCRGGHPPGTGCLRENLTWSSSKSPRLWQWPLYGTTEWERVYNQRGAVERSYAHLKSAAGPGLRRDEFRLRGIGKLTVVILADLIASNLGKIYNIASGDHELHHREHDRAA